MDNHKTTGSDQVEGLLSAFFQSTKKVKSFLSKARKYCGETPSITQLPALLKHVFRVLLYVVEKTLQFFRKYPDWSPFKCSDWSDSIIFQSVDKYSKMICLHDI